MLRVLLSFCPFRLVSVSMSSLSLKMSSKFFFAPPVLFDILEYAMMGMCLLPGCGK